MMKQHLVIQLAAADIDAQSVVAWHVFAASGELLQSGATPLAQLRAAIAAIFHDGEIWVLVPGELVLLTSVRIPSRQLRQIKQALPYVVEELIADNIEDVHLAIPDIKPTADGDMPVAVVRHHLLINWLDQLYQHGVQPDVLVPDTLAAPWREHSRSFFALGERAIYRDGAFAGQVFSRTQWPVSLQLLNAQKLNTDSGVEALGAVPRNIVFSGTDSADAAHELTALIQQTLDGDTTATDYAESSGEILAANALRQRDTLINLLQGGYAAQPHRHDELLWRRIAAVAIIGVALYSGITAASGLWFSWQAQQLSTQSFALYHQLFPQERRVVSPKKQMQAHLRGASSNAISPLPLLAKTALGLRSSLGAPNSGVQIDELQYRQQHNDLQVQLRTPTLEVLDQIKQQLNGVGLAVDINSASQQGPSTLGRINIRERQS